MTRVERIFNARTQQGGAADDIQDMKLRLAMLAAFLVSCAREPIVLVPLPDDVHYPWVDPDARGEGAVETGVSRMQLAVANAVDTASALAGAEVERLERAREEVERRHDPERADRLIDVNNASARRLERLPRVGPAMAARIIEHRPYRTPEDLLRVPGIGPATLEQIRDRISFGLDAEGNP